MQWMNVSSVKLSQTDKQMRTIHEAYQYLFKKYVDDCTKNTVANKRATLTLTIKQINSKFNEMTEDDMKKYSDMKKAREGMKSEEVQQLAMQNIPKKALAKKAKELIAKNRPINITKSVSDSKYVCMDIIYPVFTMFL